MDHWSILDAHGLDHPLIEAPGCVHRSELNVDIMRASLEKAVGHVNGGEVLSTGTICKYLIYSWDRETVGHCVRVQLAIIVDPAQEGGGVHFWYDECS